MSERGFNPIIIGVIVLALIVVGTVVFIPKEQREFLPFESFGFEVLPVSNSQDSDLLLLSGGGATYMTGQNNPVDCSAGCVSASFTLGGNDVATVGSYDTETVTVSQINGVPSDATKSNFSFYAKKKSFYTTIPLNKLDTAKQSVFDVVSISGYNRTATGYILSPTGTTLQNAYISIATNSKNSCKANGVNFVAFGYETAGVYDNSNGNPFCLSNCYYPQIHSVCVTKVNGFSAYPVDATGKTLAVQFDVQVNGVNGQTPPTTVSFTNPSAFLSYNGQTVAQVVLAGTLGTENLPPEVTGNYFGSLDKWYVFRSGDLSNFYSAYTTLRDNSYENYSTVVSNANIVHSKRSYVLNNKQTVIGTNLKFYVQGENVVIDSTFSYQPVLTLIAKGNFLGIVRNIADFDAPVCPPSKSGNVGDNLGGTARIHNISAYQGTATVSYNCVGGSGSQTFNVNGNGYQDYQVNLISATQGSSNCTVNLSYGNNQIKSCSFTGNFTVSQCLTSEICGNGKDDDCDGIVDDGCPAPPSKCGNGKIDFGETCENCSKDVEAVNGADYCKVIPPPPPPPSDNNLLFWFIVVVVMVAIVGIAYWYLYMRR